LVYFTIRDIANINPGAVTL